jgi:hypothetical protein
MPRRFSRRPKSFPERAWRALGRALARRLEARWFLPVAALLLVAASTIGLMLGRSTVAAIDPVVLRDREPPGRIRLPQDEIPPAQRSYSAAGVWFDDEACVPDCWLEPGRGAARESPPLAGSAPYYGSRADLDAAIANARRELGPAFPEVGPDMGVADGPIQRYSHFPVTREAAAADEAANDEERE